MKCKYQKKPLWYVNDSKEIKLSVTLLSGHFKTSLMKTHTYGMKFCIGNKSGVWFHENTKSLY